MCGIVGYVGPRPVEAILLSGLRRLEYRGYDSAGLATIDPTLGAEPLQVRKRAGRVHALEAMVEHHPAKGTCGISHTRWATHGRADDPNAHPHVGRDRSGRPIVAIVHNGVIENHHALRTELEADGARFVGQTDSEVIAWLIARQLEDQDRSVPDLFAAVRSILPQLHGAYGLAVVSPLCPDQLVGARFGSPLAVGLGEGEHLIASDPAAIVAHTKRVSFLDDGEIVRVTPTSLHIEHRDRGPVLPKIDKIDWMPDAVELAGHDHYMIKEIREQPETVRNACRGRIYREDGTARLGGLHMTSRHLRAIRRVILVGCGTSYHAALAGEYLIEKLARIPVEVEYASEFRYRNPPLDDRTLIFVISQSGETADTLAALRESKRRGYRTLALCNTVGSTIAREADGGLYLHAGPEIGVASTKAFLAQVTVLSLLALHLGRLKHLSFTEGQAVLDAIETVPQQIEAVLQTEPRIIAAAEQIAEANHVLFLGRDLLLPVALEGALKLKEISYLPAVGYPTAEMKHGPIALIDPGAPCVFLAPGGQLRQKTLSNIEEVRARQGPVLAVGPVDDTELQRLCEHILPVPDVPEVIQPLVHVVPLQLLAYHVARLRGCDIDKPRNLAKSVTVE